MNSKPREHLSDGWNKLSMRSYTDTRGRTPVISLYIHKINRGLGCSMSSDLDKASLTDSSVGWTTVSTVKLGSFNLSLWHCISIAIDMLTKPPESCSCWLPTKWLTVEMMRCSEKTRGTCFMCSQRLMKTHWVTEGSGAGDEGGPRLSIVLPACVVFLCTNDELKYSLKSKSSLNICESSFQLKWQTLACRLFTHLAVTKQHYSFIWSCVPGRLGLNYS